MKTDPTCGCCEGIKAVTPRPIYNRPNLAEIAARVGTYGDFLETMIARLTTHELANGKRPLQRLTSRDPSDPSIALLDACAVVADVLTFYQERIANEGYLQTATRRRSILELGRLVGYRIRPGVAASVYLAFTLEDGYDVTIPAGALARSVPGPGEEAEPFESSEPLEARARWNALPLRLSRPFLLRPPAEGTAEVAPAFLAGSDTGLEAGQMVLVTSLNAAAPYVLRSVEPDTDAGLTRITLANKRAVHTRAMSSVERGQALTPLEQLGGVVKSLRTPPSDQPASRHQLPRDPSRTYSRKADLGPQLLAEFTPELRGPLFTAYANTPVKGESFGTQRAIEALRVSAAPFGATAPLEFIYDDNGNVERREWLLTEVRSSLSVEARSTLEGAQNTLAHAFATPIDLSANEAAPVELTLRVWDPISTPRERAVPLSQFTSTDPSKGIFVWNQKFDDVAVEMQASYPGDGANRQLREITVVWQSVGEWPRDMRFLRIQRRFEGVAMTTAFSASDGIVVDFDLPGNGVIEPTTEPQQLVGGNGTHASAHFNPVATVLTVVRTENRFSGTPEAPRILSFDAEYPGVAAGSRLVVDGPMQGCHVYDVQDVRSAARADYGLSQTVTLALLNEPWLSGNEASLADIRSVTIHARNEPLELAEEPITDDLAGIEVELGTFCEGLEAGRWVAITGERTDVSATDGTPVEGIEATELAMLAGVAHAVGQTTDAFANTIDLPGDTLHTRLTFAEALAYTYRRDTATINANVVLATHGETVRQVLGSGDGAARLQTFALATTPLTHLPAPTPEGTESTLEVRVNDIRWRKSESLLALDPLDRGYQSRTDNHGVTSVTFGDGHRGARLPSGAENVTASYRAGIGARGNVEAGQITTLGSKPLGVKEVLNPRGASGGADPETRDQARLRVPLATRALDRLVSVEDYTDFAMLYAGIGKAQAIRLPDGGREVVHLSLAGAADEPLDKQSSLWRNLMTSLTKFGDPSVPVVMEPREAVFVFLSAKIRVHPDHLWETVEPPLRRALLEAFGFETRALGQPMRLSEVVAVMQRVEGVAYVDVDLFDAITESEAVSPDRLAARLQEFAFRPSASLPRRYLPAAPGRRENAELRPAQIVYLNPALADTLILTEVTS